MKVDKKENTPLLQAPENDNSHAASVDQASGSSEDPAASPLEVAAADDLQQSANKLAAPTSAPPAENGAVGGKTPPTIGSRFDEAVSKADSDFSQKNQQPITKQHPLGGASNNTPKPSLSKKQETDKQPQPEYMRYFKGSSFPRFLVIKHSDRTKNITKFDPLQFQENMIKLVGKKNYKREHLTPLKSSGLIEMEVENRDTSLKLMQTTKIGHLPVNVLIHNTKNQCKGFFVCDSIGDTSIQTVIDGCSDQMLSGLYRMTRKDGTKMDSYIGTFDCETVPGELHYGYENIKVTPFFPRPKICQKCQGYNHSKEKCNHNQICAKCGEKTNHTYSDCPGPARCVHCHKAHGSSSRECPMYTLEHEILKHRVIHRTSAQDSRQQVYRERPDLVRLIPKLKNKIPKTAANVVANGIARQQAHIEHITVKQFQEVKQELTNLTGMVNDLLQSPLFKSMMKQTTSTSGIPDPDIISKLNSCVTKTSAIPNTGKSQLPVYSGSNSSKSQGKSVSPPQLPPSPPGGNNIGARSGGKGLEKVTTGSRSGSLGISPRLEKKRQDAPPGAATKSLTFKIPETKDSKNNPNKPAKLTDTKLTSSSNKPSAEEDMEAESMSAKRGRSPDSDCESDKTNDASKNARPPSGKALKSSIPTSQPYKKKFTPTQSISHP